ncbi:MAG: hypothetical protein BWK80_18665 [Desulfobacteraceae bacterium IS3]|nr:MAG: hypothetical protein BWK80_18665 [Desulfobacteraceae bacterium IS3]
MQTVLTENSGSSKYDGGKNIFTGFSSVRGLRNYLNSIYFLLNSNFLKYIIISENHIKSEMRFFLD